MGRSSGLVSTWTRLVYVLGRRDAVGGGRWLLWSWCWSLMLRAGGWSFGTRYCCRIAGIVVEQVKWMWREDGCCRCVVVEGVRLLLLLLLLTSQVDFQSMLQGVVGRARLPSKEAEVQLRLGVVDSHGGELRKR